MDNFWSQLFYFSNSFFDSGERFWVIWKAEGHWNKFRWKK
jgi:hypothetical protein